MNDLASLPTELQPLLNGLQVASGRMMKLFLQYRGLPMGANDARTESAARILRYVTEGKLTADEVHRALVEFREYGDKRVFLFQVDPDEVQAVDPSSLPNLAASWAGARIPAAPAEPVVSYSWIDDDRIRVSFAEVHQKPRMDYTAMTFELVSDTKVVTMDVDRASGVVALAYDHPWRKHSHGHRVIDYYEHYRSKIPEILGVELEPFPLDEALIALAESDIVRMPTGRAKTLDAVFNISSDVDLRHTKGFAAVRGEIATWATQKLVWQRQQDGAAPVGGGRLMRDLPTFVDAGAGLVRFTKHTLREEVDYVLAQIRSHA